VRIHTGPGAAKAAANVGARAFTQHNHIFLGAGQSTDDVPLIAHEAAHAVQQSAEQNAEYAHGPPSASSAQLTPAMPGMIQPYFGESLVDAVGDAAGAVYDAGADAVEWVGDKLADAFWWGVKKFLPDWLADVLVKIRDRGIWGFLKDLISAPFRFIFRGLQQASDFVGGFIGQFGKLGARVAKILGAVAKGNCKPLLEGVRELKEAAAEITGAVWDPLVKFFQPVGDFFSGVWNNLLKPIGGFLKEIAGDVWDFITGLAKDLWDLTRPVRNAVSGAWDFITDLLGIGGGGGAAGEGGGGLLGWITEKAGQVWDEVKSFLKPVTEPLGKVFRAIGNFLPFRLIGNFIRSITGWAERAGEMADKMDNGGVAENQKPLRAQILPGILRAIGAVRSRVAFAGDLIAGAVTMITGGVAELIAGIANTPPFSLASGALNWLGRAADDLGGWIAGGVHGVFDAVDGCLATLAKWVDPILRGLEKIFDVLGDLVGRIGELISGIWHKIPACIREPLQDFLVNQILKRIPVFSQILAVPNIVARALGLAKKILIQVFAHGDLLGAAWTFFSGVLEFFGIPKELLARLLRGAARAIRDIIKDPIGFFGNLIGAMKQGLFQFIDHIGKHLFKGATDWLLSGVKGPGIKIPDPFTITLRNVLDLVLQVLALTKEKVFERIEAKLGKGVADKVRKLVAAGEKVLEWVQVLMTEGPAGLWKHLAADLSGLWEKLLGMVIDFLIGKIVQQATIWVTKTLASGGLSLIIDGIKAVYDALSTFAQYGKQLIEVAISVCDGVSDIAKGAIGKAADIVESAAARLVPAVLAFLAKTLGIGDLPVVIGQGIEKVRTTVVGAIDKLIIGAKSVFESLKETAKGVVSKLRDWWEAREAFTTSEGELHEIFLDGEDAGARVIIASQHLTPLDEAVSKVEANPNASKKDKEQVRKSRDIVAGTLKAIKTRGQSVGTRPDAKDADYEPLRVLNRTIRAEFRTLTPIFARHLFGPSTIGQLPKPTMNFTAASGGRPLRAEVIELSANREMGSEPGGAEPVGWKPLAETGLTTGRAPYYKRLHLINENFGGKGENRNLVPGPTVFNNLHKTGVENPIKELVGPEPKNKNYRGVVWYTAKVEYHPSGAGQQWSATVLSTGIKAEHYASEISLTWGLHEKKDDGSGNVTWPKKGTLGSYRLGLMPLPAFLATDASAIKRALS
jgi:phage-related protein